MAIEIERKFLLRDASWREHAHRSERMLQGYLAGNDECSVRVRISDDDARLNIKSATLGIERLEFEYPLPVADAEQMLRALCGARTLEKTRHYLRHGGHEWEIDEFHGANAGLVVAELELAAVDETFERPPWLGAEVSDDPRYYNSRLVEQPYSHWTQR
ncbi:MAG: CYTH domain-containing protein [Gammaproteobacteria bacterium]|nr:CYTH domain-containing protein [Gammaproteobacteria bacterium]